jgi:DNA-binding response OmpR family regulator
MASILLVEDALDLAQAVRRELAGAGYGVRHAADGLSAVCEFESEPPDLVILDWMLPGLDGLEVLRRIRAASAVPVLMLTARCEEVDRVIGLELGADDYLTKPFSMRELVARVRALLRRMQRLQEIMRDDQAPAERAVAYGALRLDPGSYRATQDGAELELTRTEFDLLHLLMRNPGRAFGRAYLLDTIWGGNYVAGDRSVDNAILRLRKKLGDMGEAIETIWGVGYRLRRRG